VVRALDKKLLRDMVRLWAQALAIALVMASGVTTLILAVGAYRSLEETRSAYYERYRFAEVFASTKRAPEFVERQILEISGVATTETRISEFALLDIEGMEQPATGRALSLPDYRDATLNRIFLREGRLPEIGRVDEVTINEAFAKAQGFKLGSRFHAILNGYKRPLTVVGIALSPEFIYAVGPGDLIPDDRRFGILWMSEKALAAIFDLDGAFNSVSLKLLRGANSAEVIQQLDDILERYGGTGAVSRKDQPSHAFIDAELKQLKSMAQVIPPIFLLVSAFLINITLTRLIALEREQIGLLKALGYWRTSIAVHYMTLIICIAAVGIFIGFFAGTWLGQGLTRLYADFFHFPFLIFQRGIDIYVIAAGISITTALAGGMRSIYTALTLPPAVAMSPPLPTHYTHLGIEKLQLVKQFSQLTIMAIRHIIRWPVRSGLTVLGISMSGALLITALFSLDSIEFMIDTIYFQADRQDATLNFTQERPVKVLQEVEHLPGVLAVEPYRSVAVRLRHGHYHRKLAIVGRAPNADLSRVLDKDNHPVELPQSGLLLSKRVAKLLHVSRGDMVDIEILDDSRGQGSLDATSIGTRRSTRRLPVAGVIQSFLGLAVYMDLNALNEMLDEAPVVSGVHMAIDDSQTKSLFKAIKGLPAVSSIALQGASLAKFRETLAKNLTIMTSVYVVLSIIIAFGVVYNSARIQLSERAREFASLRVLGFTKGEVSHVLLLELAMLVLTAIPLAWFIGYGFAWATVQGFESDLYSLPFIIKSDTYAISAFVVLAAATVSALLVRRRIDQLDMIKALKTRE
jgi:putative ABC transport system permease protein